MKPRISPNLPLASKAIEFIRSISSDSQVLIVHDADPDGLCSGVLLQKIIERLSGAKVTPLVGVRNNLGEDALNLLKTRDFSHVITTDMQVDQDRSELETASNYAKVLVLDHHPVVNAEIEGVVVCKPKLMIPEIHARYGASILVYDMFNGVVDITDLKWVMCIGFIADFGSFEYPELVKDIYEEFGWQVPQNIFESHCGLAGAAINNARLVEAKPEEIYQILLSAASLNDLWSHEVIKKGEDITANVLALAKDAQENGEWYGDTLWYIVDNEYNIRSPVTTMIGIDNWDKTIICVTPLEKVAWFSSRRNDGKVPLDQILAKNAKELGGNGGGHAVACGGQVPIEKLEDWKARVLHELKSYK